MNRQLKAPRALTIVGPGRVGRSISKAAENAGIQVETLGRGFDPAALAHRTILICVPDSAIGEVVDRIASSGPLPRYVGHSSGVTSLAPLVGCQSDGAFSIHPLQTVPDGSTDLRDCPAAVAGSTPDAMTLAEDFAMSIGMKPFDVPESDRVLYHAAASIAANYLVTLEQTAAGLFSDIGVDDPRAALAPLVRRSLANWEELGAAALTGPIARGDEATIAEHREALAGRHPEILALYDVMAERTRAIAT